MWVDIGGEWDLSCSQGLILAWSEVAIQHVDGNIFSEPTNTREGLERIFTKKVPK